MLQTKSIKIHLDSAQLKGLILNKLIEENHIPSNTPPDNVMVGGSFLSMFDLGATIEWEEQNQI